jgi:tetratricopeptide (TPR) repeat protein
VRKLIARLPEDPRGWRVLASAYMASGDAARALEASRRAAQLTPKDPRGPLLVGLALRALGRPAEARAAFEASLELAPGFADPLAQLVAMAAADDKLDVALERVTRELRKAPSSSRLQAILGAVHAQRRDLPTSEAAYRRALELEPGLMAAHVALAQVLVAAGRPDDALAALARARAVDPNNVGVLMLIATVHERRGDIARAREAYEQLLAINPRFAPAANSLAWIYSEHGGDKEKALQLARTAKQLTPADPRVSDTLGWILYKRGVYHQARALLQESVAQLPDNIEVQYHFGMAAWKAGARQQAVAALQKAVASPTPFAGKDEASRVLSGLR